MIMEINTSFGEKKNVLFRLTGDSKCHLDNDNWTTPPSLPIDTTFMTSYNKGTTLRFMASESRGKFFKGSWEKDIFASPYETAHGSFSLKFTDPQAPIFNEAGLLNTTMNNIAPSGKPKILSRLWSWGQPVNPLTVSSWDLTKFLVSWTIVGPLSVPRIVKEAIRVRLRGNLKYLKKPKPEVLRTNIPRNETEIERYFFFCLASRTVRLFPLTQSTESSKLTSVFIYSISCQNIPIL